jgi:thiol oxidase
MIYLKQLLSKVNEQSNGFSRNTFREMIDMKTSNAYLPDDHDQYQYCAGSEPEYRGYPCALWLLFHTLTVSQYQKGFSLSILFFIIYLFFLLSIESNQINVIEIPSAIKGYIKHFFACEQCRNNFMKETADINQLDTKNKYEAIMYLWKSSHLFFLQIRLYFC